VRAFFVVEVDGLLYPQTSLGQVVGQGKQEFVFPNTVPALGPCVLVAGVAVGRGAA